MNVRHIILNKYAGFFCCFGQLFPASRAFSIMLFLHLLTYGLGHIIWKSFLNGLHHSFETAKISSDFPKVIQGTPRPANGSNSSLYFILFYFILLAAQ